MLTPKKVSFLCAENQSFAETGGVSKNNAHANFVPAFKDTDTGEVTISRFKDGRPAPCHVIDGLPDKWIIRRDLKGCVIELKVTIVSGFVRLGRFFSRQEAADFMEHYYQ
ncbi:MAG: hypothetical protein GYB20_09225 [Oceanospirillales bacterium]|nr:hypothetical protein [Oceanospirillales bacterium]MBR9887856.1 hypothetical protein [Oceanospirillales bacterium]